MIKSLTLAAAAGAAILAIAGCGGDDNDTTTTSAPTTTQTTPAPKGGAQGKATNLEISADQSQLRFDTSELTAKAGKVTITMENPSGIPHSVAIEGNGIDKEGTGGTSGVAKGEKSELTADLKPGTYKFYCPVDGHEQGGMKGTLTVK